MTDTPLDPLDLLRRYYRPGTRTYEILTVHSELVARKALELADRIPDHRPDRRFLWEAAMLHDIGILHTHSPEIGCHGEHPYLMHGCLGREMLEAEGLPRHALVCERHTGVGLTREDIRRQGLPLPDRDMVPVSLEEQIICFADCFFSKNPKRFRSERPLEKVRKSARKWGGEKQDVLENWVRLFRLDGHSGGGKK